MWEGVFEYDPSLPSCLRRVEPIRLGKNYSIIRETNNMAGTPRVYRGIIKGWFVKYKTRMYGIHRIIYEIFNGKIEDGLLIDHINKNPLDNRIENLRKVPKHINNRNKNMFKNNTTGFNGVSYSVNPGTEVPYFTATWHEDGKLRKKNFSVKIYGEEVAKQLAIEFRIAKIKELNEKGYGYTEHHGL